MKNVQLSVKIVSCLVLVLVMANWSSRGIAQSLEVNKPPNWPSHAVVHPNGHLAGQFYIRPLDQGNAAGSFKAWNALPDVPDWAAPDTAFWHEHFFCTHKGFEGTLDIGYGTEGIYSGEDPRQMNGRVKPGHDRLYDIYIMYAAGKRLVKSNRWRPDGGGFPWEYNVVTHNCQDFADALRKEYDRLKNIHLIYEMSYATDDFLVADIYDDWLDVEPIFNRFLVIREKLSMSLIEKVHETTDQQRHQLAIELFDEMERISNEITLPDDFQRCYDRWYALNKEYWLHCKCPASSSYEHLHETQLKEALHKSASELNDLWWKYVDYEDMNEWNIK